MYKLLNKDVERCKSYVTIASKLVDLQKEKTMNTNQTAQYFFADIEFPFVPVNIPGKPELSKLYAVNCMGQVIALPRVKSNGQGTYTTGMKLLSTNSVDGQNYHHVVLIDLQSNRTLVKIHRLVMLTFCPREDHAKMVVDHINGNKTDNTVHNLRWLTVKENNMMYQLAVKTGRAKKPVFGLTIEQMELIDATYETHTITEIAQLCGVTYTKVCNYLKKYELKTIRQQKLIDGQLENI